VNDLLHVLNTSEVSKHVPDGNNVSIGDKGLGDALSTTDLTGTDWLIYQHVHAKDRRWEDVPSR
jgi:hypothetical protein